jgi:hypothetical protein
MTYTIEIAEFDEVKILYALLQRSVEQPFHFYIRCTEESEARRGEVEPCPPFRPEDIEEGFIPGVRINFIGCIRLSERC